ncbi:antitoxin family protein [Candidatus Sumerlaeota bacterium]|nr:antitoxin family protein [Candidatus Sumerlaeota bacterium]
MKTTFKAVFEHGQLRPLEPVDLEEGDKVTVVWYSEELMKKTRTPFEVLKKISEIFVLNQDNVFCGEDHDQILYGKGKK